MVEMLRITPVRHSERRIVLKIEGRLVSRSLEMLESECSSYQGSGQEVVLDLAGVVFLDGNAAALLDRLRAGGITLLRSPAFIQELIDETCHERKIAESGSESDLPNRSE